MTRTREDIALDLPFHVNGTLSEAERAEVDAWLAEDALLRAEHDALAVIRAEMQAEMQAEDVRTPGEFGLSRLMRDVGREGSALAAPPTPSRTWMWQLAAAVAVIAFLAQSLFVQRDTGEAGFTLAGATGSADMIVSFAPDATEEQIRLLLIGLDVEIVAGPSAIGLYHLDVLEGSDAEAALAGLSAATEIVESVEYAQN